MFKKIKKNKGFTLIEILVAVLILAILVAIAVPLYTRAVERSRTSDPINTLKSIAKAEQVQRLRVGEYTNQTQNLDLELKDYPAGNTVAGDTFEGQYYTYKVYGEDEAAATATRKAINEDEEYILSVDYGTGELFCRPATNKTCIDLGLEEGRDFSPPKWEACSASTAGRLAGLQSIATSCQVMVNKKENRTSFDLCMPNTGYSYHLYAATSVGMPKKCMRGYYEGDKLVSCYYESPDNNTCVRGSVLEPVAGGGIYLDCTSYNQNTGFCANAYLTFYSATTGQQVSNGYCSRFNSEGICTSLTCFKGNCSEFGDFSVNSLED